MCICGRVSVNTPREGKFFLAAERNRSVAALTSGGSKFHSVTHLITTETGKVM